MKNKKITLIILIFSIILSNFIILPNYTEAINKSNYSLSESEDIEELKRQIDCLYEELYKTSKFYEDNVEEDLEKLIVVGSLALDYYTDDSEKYEYIEHAIIFLNQSPEDLWDEIDPEFYSSNDINKEEIKQAYSNIQGFKYRGIKKVKTISVGLTNDSRIESIILDINKKIEGGEEISPTMAPIRSDNTGFSMINAYNKDIETLEDIQTLPNKIESLEIDIKCIRELLGYETKEITSWYISGNKRLRKDNSDFYESVKVLPVGKKFKKKNIINLKIKNELESRGYRYIDIGDEEVFTVSKNKEENQINHEFYLPDISSVIKYHSNGGIFNDEKTLTTRLASIGSMINSYNPNDISRVGYRFKYWSFDILGLEKLSDEKVEKLEDGKTYHLYAQWESEKNSKEDKGINKSNNNFGRGSIIDKPTDNDIKEHTSYIEGYEDGTVRADDEITRAEIAAIIYRVLGYGEKEINDSSKLEYPYIDESYKWSKEYIKKLTSDKLLKGYPNYKFRPNNSITRAELAVIISRYKKLDSGENSFMDVTDHWAEKEIGYALNMGYIQGYPDGSFRPDRAITRAELVTIINKMLDRGVLKKDIKADDIIKFKDLKGEEWYYEDIVEATNGHNFSKKNDKLKVRENEHWNFVEQFNEHMYGRDKK